ncbi:MAG: hypothetical protein CMJ75_01010 [Planctomycetaceae bacterium]|nr:hypothetical protein [Planctomycetaceae bacterium]
MLANKPVLSAPAQSYRRNHQGDDNAAQQSINWLPNRDKEDHAPGGLTINQREHSRQTEGVCPTYSETAQQRVSQRTVANTRVGRHSSDT